MKDVWQDVSIIRHKKTETYRAEASQDPFLSSLAVFVHEVTESSRPSTADQSEFKTKFTRCEVTVKPQLPGNLRDKEAIEHFLRDVWDFAFAFSSYVSEWKAITVFRKIAVITSSLQILLT